MDIDIRQATFKDVEYIVVLNQLFHLDVLNFYWDKPKWIRAAVQSGSYYVATKGGSVIGAVCISYHANHAQLDAIAVDQKYQKRGIGKMLIMYIENIAIQNSYDKLVIESFTDYGLEKFYSSCGYMRTSIEIDLATGKTYNLLTKTLTP